MINTRFVQKENQPVNDFNEFEHDRIIRIGDRFTIFKNKFLGTGTIAFGDIGPVPDARVWVVESIGAVYAASTNDVAMFYIIDKEFDVPNPAITGDQTIGRGIPLPTENKVSGNSIATSTVHGCLPLILNASMRIRFIQENTFSGGTLNLNFLIQAIVSEFKIKK